MKRFYFSLENVLRYKEQTLDNLRAEHAARLREIRRCERELLALEEEHRLCREDFAKEKAGGMRIADVYTYEHYLDATGLRIAAKKEELALWERRAEEKRAEVVEAKKETSSIDKLKEKKLAEYEKEARRQEERLIEEFVSTKRAMAALLG